MCMFTHVDPPHTHKEQAACINRGTEDTVFALCHWIEGS